MTNYSELFKLDDEYCYKKIEIIRIYDGDTIYVNINLGLSIFMKNVSVRLYGINAPEIKGGGKEEGINVKNILTNLLKNKEIQIYTIEDKHDKYGRLLGILVDKNDNTNYNLHLLENNLVKPYFI